MQVTIKPCEYKCYKCRVKDGEVFNLDKQYCSECWQDLTYTFADYN